MGSSPLTSDAYDSPPPYSPPRSLCTKLLQTSPTPERINLPSSQLSPYPAPEPIPNPIIPGGPAPSAEALFNMVNTFAKESGFGIVRRNRYSYKGRLIGYSFQCDRSGQPRVPESSSLRKRKSRKCGCFWKITAESLEEGKWVLRQHTDPNHRQHNHGRSITPSAHLSHRRLYDTS